MDRFRVQSQILVSPSGVFNGMLCSCSGFVLEFDSHQGVTSPLNSEVAWKKCVVSTQWTFFCVFHRKTSCFIWNKWHYSVGCYFVVTDNTALILKTHSMLTLSYTCVVILVVHREWRSLVKWKRSFVFCFWQTFMIKSRVFSL